ncbi:MAG: response regulator [Lachnospiraceae bacterium]|nr:response regulator [Lachnospiraceae bacterium]
MNLKDILLIIQYLIIFLMFAEGVVIFRKWKSPLHGYLFLYCISALVNNIGYLLELVSNTEGEYITALKLSYGGRVFITLMLFFFVAKLTHVKFFNGLKAFLLAFHMGIYAFVLTIPLHNLYYSSFEFTLGKYFPVVHHGNGIVHDIFMASQFIYIALGFIWLFMALFKAKSKTAKRQLGAVILAIFSEASFFLIQVTGIFPVSDYYDLTMIGYVIGTILMFVAIYSFDLLGAKEIAKEYVIDNISEAVIAVDNNGKVNYFNNIAGELYPEFLKGDTTFPSEIEDVITNGGHVGKLDRYYDPQKNNLILDGVKYGTIYVLVDETGHFTYMAELKKQRSLAKAANEAKSRFLANMSHEIRTPINAVLGFDEMILRESNEESIRGYAANIRSSGKALLSLINDILDFSKIEEGKMTIVPAQYDLSSLVNDLINMIKGRADKKGLILNVDVDESIPHLLYGDEMRIKQCILNLLTNAVKYTEKGSVSLKVTMNMKEDYGKKVKVKGHGYSVGNIELKVMVNDTGIGMKQEAIEKLFAPFERIEEKRNRAIEGTGLGMSIVRQLLELMDSSLSVESEYGKGSKFSFSIKQEVVAWEEIGRFTGKIDENKGKDYVYREKFHASLARILVVDDTEMNLTVVKSLLKKTKINIDTALNGMEAVNLCKNNKYDAIFIDHMMPDMDGIETLTNIREEGLNKDTPAVALTANAISGAREMYLEAGFNDYLSKPVDGEKLEKLLIKLLPSEKVDKDYKEENKAEPSAESRSSVLVVDDDEAVCTLCSNILKPYYMVELCMEGKKAVGMASELKPDLILLDIHMFDINGFEVLKQLKENESIADIPVLMITGDADSETEKFGFKSGVSDYIRKPFAPDVLLQRAKRIIDLTHYQKSIESEVRKQTRLSKRLAREMMITLSKTVDTKDHYTDGHSRRVAALCAEIGRRMGLRGKEQILLYEIGLLHDIGKIGIHDDIIHKTTRLTDEEFAIVKSHSLKGYEILKEISDMPRLCEGARWHHERYDGSGYPDGLKGNEIPLEARIACIADCYDAMTSTRTYSVPKSKEEVENEILRCRGTWFDPKVADTLLDMMKEDTEFKMNEKAKPQDVWKGYKKLWEGAGNSDDENIISLKPESLNNDKPGIASDNGSQEENDAALPEGLKEIDEIDINSGIKNCGSIDGYLSVLDVFVKTASFKADEIESLYRDRDLENYTIKVHALKSSARIIGAMELSDMARELENAGKNGDNKYIDENTGKLIADYRSLYDKLSILNKVKEKQEKIDPEMLKEAYQTAAEIAESMDYGLMDDLLNSLKKYDFSDNDAKAVSEMEKALTELDFDKIKVIAKNGGDNGRSN